MVLLKELTVVSLIYKHILCQFGNIIAWGQFHKIKINFNSIHRPSNEGLCSIQAFGFWLVLEIKKLYIFLSYQIIKNLISIWSLKITVDIPTWSGLKLILILNLILTFNEIGPWLSIVRQWLHLAL